MDEQKQSNIVIDMRATEQQRDLSAEAFRDYQQLLNFLEAIADYQQLLNFLEAIADSQPDLPESAGKVVLSLEMEREAFAMLRALSKRDLLAEIDAALAEARAQEREACAKIADVNAEVASLFVSIGRNPYDKGVLQASRDCATAIRARGGEKMTETTETTETTERRIEREAEAIACRPMRGTAEENHARWILFSDETKEVYRLDASVVDAIGYVAGFDAAIEALRSTCRSDIIGLYGDKFADYLASHRPKSKGL